MKTPLKQIFREKTSSSVVALWVHYWKSDTFLFLGMKESLKKVSINILWGVPLLLSKETIKNRYTVIDFKNDSVRMLDQK